ncbi:serine carboxypeptidase-like 20 [Ziziphus jujuba]|uniref:Serine carboxypeptidase-like 20 n=1 Tax=Ziziphus jujuba TaxID=326968 RepID=A0A6P3ZCS8_ZIZJJ|nr:serine carboxypeptidase-like 20 [Ziziphus jujuba]
MAKFFFFFFFFTSLCMLLTLFVTEAAPKTSLVKTLPGFKGSFPSKHYSGYITLGGEKPADQGKNLFYYFVESERKPATDPVVLWLNGGPGCSSFDGFVYEHGPFNFKEGKPKGSLPILYLNPYSWSKVSNIIYLDSPTGVGFSYSKDPRNYVTGDLKTAYDTHNFLLKWFEQFPEFLSNPFYITGESFAGIYVPTLASQVVQGIKDGAKRIINFKGYMVGNGVTDRIFDGNALVPFAHGMGLISDDIYKEVVAACEGIYYQPQSVMCDDKLEQVHQAIEGLNIYNILEPCYHNPTYNQNDKLQNSTLPSSFQQLGKTQKPLPVRKRIYGRAWPFQAQVRDGLVPLWPQLAASTRIAVPCVNDEVATRWLNDKAVRNAIHAVPESVSGRWTLCTNRISYYHDAGSMIPYHLNLTLQGYRALIYSGDHDMCVPFTGTQAWTKSLGYKILDEWRPWFSNGIDVAGFLQGYEKNFTFITVKGSGHTVPEYKPQEALHFYSRWLAGLSI